MDLTLLVKGYVLGLSVAAIIGPMALLCMQLTLARGFRYGFGAGLGIATADMSYACVAAFGLTVVSTFLVSLHWWLHLLGGLFLLYLGVRTLLTRPGKRAAALHMTGLLSTYATTFLMTLTNPLTILSFAAIFAGAGPGLTQSTFSALAYVVAALFVIGVFLGSVSWWLLLTGIVAGVRMRLTDRILLWINRVAGTVLIVFGIFSIGSSWS